MSLLRQITRATRADADRSLWVRSGTLCCACMCMHRSPCSAWVQCVGKEGCGRGATSPRRIVSSLTTGLRVYYPRLSMDHIISPPTDDIPETDSFIYNSSFAPSETSIASYKTEKTINSRKSRYNALPGHKYAGIGFPNDVVSLGVGVPKVSYWSLRLG